MKTLTLKTLHERSIKELELVEKCKLSIARSDDMIKAKEDNDMNYLAYSFAELIEDIKKAQAVEKRVYIWYLQTLNKIMRFSN